MYQKRRDFFPVPWIIIRIRKMTLFNPLEYIIETSLGSMLSVILIPLLNRDAYKMEQKSLLNLIYTILYPSLEVYGRM
jgi:hypothetical protein